MVNKKNYSLFTATAGSHCTGITLIALIITIILLLILAGVTLHFTLGENGIIKNVEIAGNKYKEEEQKEKNALDEMYSKILVADDSKVTLTMEQLDEYIDRRIEEKSANKASAVVSSSETYQTNNSNENVSFDSIILGNAENKFILEDGKIKIGKGVKRIVVSAYVTAKSSVPYTGLAVFVNKNGETFSDGYCRAIDGKRINSVMSYPMAISVKEGDYLELVVSDWGEGGNFVNCCLVIYEL